MADQSNISNGKQLRMFDVGDVGEDSKEIKCPKCDSKLDSVKKHHMNV